MEFIWHWVDRQLSEDLLGTVALFLLFVFVIVPALWQPVRHALCKHKRFRENRACDGICESCGKNLGFIQPLRNDPTKKEV